MRKLQLYIEGERVELFNDEKIVLNSSVQNVNDISKVFTDFTQSFTVPASPKNNDLFQHFYASEVDGTIDHRIRRSAKIEVDHIPFKTGKIQIEKSNLKKGQVESYTITFYGDIRTLQDYFGDEKLSSLDLTAYTHNYTGAEVKTRITSSSAYDIRYPLISSDRAWTYGDNASTDISKNSDHIHYDELFPAIRISRIFEAIENKYGIDFQGLFLGDKRFTDCYLWLKNKKQYTPFSAEKEVDLYDKSYPTQLGSGFDYIVNERIDLTNNTIRIAYAENSVDDPIYNEVFTHVLNLSVNTDVPAQWYIDVYKNGVLFTTLTNVSATGTIQSNFTWSYSVFNQFNFGLDETFSFKARGTTTQELYIRFRYALFYSNLGSKTLSEINYASIIRVPFTAQVDVSGSMPDMTISEFVSGVLKQFNLTCTGLNPTTFEIEPLEEWYSKGRVLDVTKYIDIDSVDIERVKLYKNVRFEHEPSPSFTNVAFFDNFKRQYGDLAQSYEYDGGDYVIKVPFENLLHNKFTNTDLQVAYSLDKDLQPYIPKPVLLYMNSQKTCSFYFNDGSTTTQITSYMPFGQDLIYNGLDYSLNFGWDNSTMLNAPVDNNIFTVYYLNYLSNLYSKKNRLYYYKGIFPTAILTSLKLNDRLIIRDKRYIINEIKTDLNTGEVDLTLLLDFRPVQAYNNTFTQGGNNILTVPFVLPNDVSEINIDVGTTGVTANTYQVTQDTNVTFTTPAVTPSYTLIAENNDTLLTENFDKIADEEYTPETFNIDLEYVYFDGTTINDVLILINAG